MGRLIQRIKQRYEITTNKDLAMILLVFSLAGSSVGFLARPVIHFLFQAVHHVPMWLKTVSYVFVAVPLYQALLLLYGFLTGQFRFFWKRTKQMGNIITRLWNKPAKASLAPQPQESEYV